VSERARSTPAKGTGAAQGRPRRESSSYAPPPRLRGDQPRCFGREEGLSSADAGPVAVPPACISVGKPRGGGRTQGHLAEQARRTGPASAGPPAEGHPGLGGNQRGGTIRCAGAWCYRISTPPGSGPTGTRLPRASHTTRAKRRGSAASAKSRDLATNKAGACQRPATPARTAAARPRHDPECSKYRRFVKAADQAQTRPGRSSRPPGPSRDQPCALCQEGHLEPRRSRRPERAKCARDCALLVLSIEWGSGWWVVSISSGFGAALSCASGSTPPQTVQWWREGPRFMAVRKVDSFFFDVGNQDPKSTSKVLKCVVVEIYLSNGLRFQVIGSGFSLNEGGCTSQNQGVMFVLGPTRGGSLRKRKTAVTLL